MSHADSHDAAFTLTIEPLSRTVAVRGNASLLEAANHAGIRLPSSCRNGTCRACMCRLVAGHVSYRVEWPGVSPEERRDGWVLPCVALPASDVTIEQPEAQLHAAPAVRARSRGF
jgi:ferredoxin